MAFPNTLTASSISARTVDNIPRIADLWFCVVRKVFDERGQIVIRRQRRRCEEDVYAENVDFVPETRCKAPRLEYYLWQECYHLERERRKELCTPWL